MSFGEAKTPDRLERALQASLRPVDPGADFTMTLMSRLASEPAQLGRPVVVPGARQRRLHSASLALAASVVVALAVSWQLLDIRAAQLTQQARIRAQVLLALQITNERLGVAQQRIEQFQSQEKNL
jgi:hypothetical protein